MPPPRPPRPTDADRAVWDNYATGIVPLRGPGAHVASASPPSGAEQVAVAELPRGRPRLPPRGPAVPAPPVPAPPRPLGIGDPPGGVDDATWQRFRTGKLAAARKLDLHGYTAQRAYHALAAFLRAARADRVRCVEVVTGRGSGDEPGVLRRELPLWLNLPDIRPLVLAAAHPHAANPGAVRLLLRRIR